MLLLTGSAATFTVTTESQPWKFCNTNTCELPAGTGVPLKSKLEPGQALAFSVPVLVGNAATFTVRIESQPWAVCNIKTCEEPAGIRVPLKLKSVPAQAVASTDAWTIGSAATFTVSTESHPWKFCNTNTCEEPAGIDVPLKS